MEGLEGLRIVSLDSAAEKRRMPFPIPPILMPIETKKAGNGKERCVRVSLREQITFHTVHASSLSVCHLFIELDDYSFHLKKVYSWMLISDLTK